ncbi:hypothetical protein [Microcoleus vaginatus]|uniref:hypothetical protein n=1 Tax=Microcoleus vaginatus TaxID=119532 RepID=UPI0002F10EBD
MCAIAAQIEQFLPEIFNIAGSRGIVGSRKIYSDSKETGFFTRIKGFKGFDAVFSSIKPGFCVISHCLLWDDRIYRIYRYSHISKRSRVKPSDS